MLVLCSDATSLIGTLAFSIRTMDECRSAVHRRVGIGTDGADDLLDLAMIACTRIIAPGAAVALQEQRRIVGPALGCLSQSGRQLHGDRDAVPLQLFLGAVSVATLGGLRHHQLRPHRMIMQIFDAQTDGLARTCASDRQRIGQQPELIIELVGGGDEFAHLVIRQDDVARRLRVGQTGKSDLPSIPVLNALVVLRRLLQCGAQASDRAD